MEAVSSATVLWLAFAVAFIFGAIGQKTHFCTMGAVSDIVNMGDWSRMRMWLLAIGVAILGAGLFIRDPLSVGLSVVGALALNLVLAVNHKQGRYLGT